MSSKFILTIKIILIIVLIFSIVQFYLVWQEFTYAKNKDLNYKEPNLNDSTKISRQIKTKYMSKFVADIETQSLLTKKNYFNVKEEKEINQEDNTVKEKVNKTKEKNYPDTNLPNYLTNEDKDLKKNINYTLIAISNQGDNSRCIIRDENVKKTFILKVGEEINSLKIKEIKKNIVVADWQGKEIKLNLMESDSNGI